MKTSTFAGQTLPTVIHGDDQPDGVLEFVAREREPIKDLIGKHGAILLRGFRTGGVLGLNALVRAFSGTAPVEYAERSSPRSALGGNVYSSTDYPADEEIFLHNENSYQSSWPRLLFFQCLSEPETLGATPLADIRAVYDSIDPSVRAEFERRRWMYVRNFHDELGLGWREVFGTPDRAAVDAYCAERKIVTEWRGNDGLRVSAVREPVHRHPESGDPVWFNHATFFHVTTLPAAYRAGLLEIFAEEELPANTYYGDGGVIPDDVLAHVRDCYRSARVRFDWRQDDVLIVDNMLVAHAREPFTGPRRIAVAMAGEHGIQRT